VKSSVRGTCLAIGMATVCAVLAAPASAAADPPDYSCDIGLSVANELYNNSSGTFDAAGAGECWLDDPTDRVQTQFSASGSYVAQRCSLISVVQPSYLTLTGTLTITPAAASGLPAATTGVTITTADVATLNTGAGTISLGSGQLGYVRVKYDNPVLGTIARCGGNRFRPVYNGTFAPQ
jgi:hypothetical protein